jgi:hypothetical protein
LEERALEVGSWRFLAEKMEGGGIVWCLGFGVVVVLLIGAKEEGRRISDLKIDRSGEKEGKVVLNDAF